MLSTLSSFRRAPAPFLAAMGVGLVLTSSVLSGCGAGPAEAVTAWTPFTASDKSFAGEGPTGWDTTSGDLGGTSAKVSFTKGNATITTTSDSASSFMADGMRAGAKPAVEVLHEKSLTSLGESLGELEPQTAQPMTSPLGSQARYCEFTANGGKTHGYHVTIQGSERMIYVNAYCPEDDWATLKPAFSNYIAKLKSAAA